MLASLKCIASRLLVVLHQLHVLDSQALLASLMLLLITFMDGCECLPLRYPNLEPVLQLLQERAFRWLEMDWFMEIVIFI